MPSQVEVAACGRWLILSLRAEYQRVVRCQDRGSRRRRRHFHQRHKENDKYYQGRPHFRSLQVRRPSPKTISLELHVPLKTPTIIFI